MDIEAEILDGFVEAEDGTRFLPGDVIDHLAARGPVRDHIHTNYQGPSNEADVESLVKYVTDKSNPAKRLFLTLVYCDRLQYLGLMQKAGFHDTDLPIEVKWDKTNKRFDVYTNKKAQSNSNSRKLWDCFYHWKDRRDVEDFENRQWYFLAPIFVAGVFDYHFSLKCPLPIVEKSTSSRKTGYSGIVTSVKIHEAHMQVQTPTHTILPP